MIYYIVVYMNLYQANHSGNELFITWNRSENKGAGKPLSILMQSSTYFRSCNTLPVGYKSVSSKRREVTQLRTGRFRIKKPSTA